MKLRRRALLWAGLALPLAAQAQTAHDVQWTDAKRQRTLPLKIRLPAGEKPVPLVVFSHGLGGSREGGKAWGEHWAANGYAVIHLQHPGSDESVWKQQAAGTPKQNLLRGGSLDQFMVRVQDVVFVLDELARAQAGAASAAQGIAQRLDLSRIAMSGHSFGALTTLALGNERYAGRIGSLADKRFSAFIAFSPTVMGDAAQWPQRYGSMTQPFFTVTGSIDGDVLGTGGTPDKRAKLFDVQPAGDKYRVVFEDGDHSVFNGGALAESQWMDWVTGQKNPKTPPATAARIHESVKRSTLMFLDAYLKQDPAAKAWLQNNAAAYFGTSAVWSQK